MPNRHYYDSIPAFMLFAMQDNEDDDAVAAAEEEAAAKMEAVSLNQ